MMPYLGILCAFGAAFTAHRVATVADLVDRPNSAIVRVIGRDAVRDNGCWRDVDVIYCVVQL